MPPTRGHDLKLAMGGPVLPALCVMPPTRGHDLKHRRHSIYSCSQWMPPTRGHDLKRRPPFGYMRQWPMPPHTGARLETHRHTGKQTPAKMPPTRGHDLKQLVRGPMRVPGGDASTPGNVLKYFAPHLANTPGDAPTVSLLSVLLSSLFSLTLF